MRSLPILLFLPALACTEPAYMTDAEALEALVESASSSRGEAAVREPIQVSTSFTIGDALDAAAQYVADLWASQAACSTVTVEGATLTVDFGGLDDPCTFHGRTYGGVASATIGSTTPGNLEVLHTWTGLTDGEVQVDGGAVVTWSGADDTRRVVTEHTWTSLLDGTEVDVEGDHVQGWIDPSLGLWGGITLEGTRDWSAPSGDWHLDMRELEIRLQDPVPQAGQFVVLNPHGKELEIAFARLDERTIEATLTGTREPLVFHIDPLGIPHEAE